MTSYAGFSDAYLHRLRALLDEPRYRNAPRGFPSQEELGVSLRVADPRRRLVTHPARRTNIVFNFAEALWYLAGRDDVEYLAYYAPMVRRFSQDGVRLTGTAYGPRIFRHGPTRLDQWAAVRELLRADPDTKRAVIQIFEPEELGVPGNPDVACTLALQFLLRENALHLVGYMRANDVYRGMVSDVFSFTFLQEVMAGQLGVELGSYTHMVGSLHLYESDIPAARRVLRPTTSVSTVDDRMPAMPSGDNRPHIDDVLRWEHRLRRNEVRLDPDALDRSALPDYWRQVVVLFELYRRVRHGDGGAEGLWQRLCPLYRTLMLRRFPGLAGQEHAVEVSGARS
ncbi:thymidylate synthase [Streptoalloteichus tenebrarius]|uniref:Thymidylate synthase n=1 Tax=Streptoalloteichus tenebrarius (strain ATCC 17920 / DSM 40477 / JCM 4838 / CBS 697.72 / NBRC 16177 / NCIMB 11028 / NRRL B-12390 / A12253. 1 / ISP 5477) TaxID=1933 RepID=A0ABT1HRL2_STRSD|nr:thymidylate synthase [Streptoalloteichus tenebrarius]MCP2258153.1 thymidylate synthase [Streptoalloteichus tenebrarius]BFF04620.1 thymidylate synthase [Streptoalloteichus tenebrarius]